MTDTVLASMENHFEVKFGMESKEYNFVLNLIRELHAERAKVAELTNALEIIIEPESNISQYKNLKLIANENYPLRYITKDGLVDVKFIDG